MDYHELPCCMTMNYHDRPCLLNGTIVIDHDPGPWSLTVSDHGPGPRSGTMLKNHDAIQQSMVEHGSSWMTMLVRG